MQQSPWESNITLTMKFPAFYDSLPSSQEPDLSLSEARSVQSTLSNPVSLRSVLMLFFHLHLGLPSILPYRLRNQNFVFISPMHMTYPTHFIPLYLILLTIFSEQYNLCSSSLSNFLNLPVTSSYAQIRSYAPLYFKANFLLAWNSVMASLRLLRLHPMN